MYVKLIKILRNLPIDKFPLFPQIHTAHKYKMSIPIIFHSLESTLKVLQDDKVTYPQIISLSSK